MRDEGAATSCMHTGTLVVLLVLCGKECVKWWVARVQANQALNSVNQPETCRAFRKNK